MQPGERLGLTLSKKEQVYTETKAAQNSFCRACSSIQCVLPLATVPGPSALGCELAVQHPHFWSEPVLRLVSLYQFSKLLSILPVHLFSAYVARDVLWRVQLTAFMTKSRSYYLHFLDEQLRLRVA